MRHCNRIELVGDLGINVEERKTAKEKPVIAASLATTAWSKNAEAGEFVAQKTWHNLRFYGKLAERAKEQLKAGNFVPYRIIGQQRNETGKPMALADGSPWTPHYSYVRVLEFNELVKPPKAQAEGETATAPEPEDDAPEVQDDAPF